MVLQILSTALFEHCKIRLPNLSVVLIWTSGLIFFVGLTAYGVYPLFEDYTYNNVDTKLEIIAQNRTTVAPSLTFCIPFETLSLNEVIDHLQASNNSRECATCTNLSNRGFDLKRENITFSSSALKNKDIISVVLLRKLFENANNSEDIGHILDVSNFDWNKPIVEAVWNLFSCISQYDYSDKIKCELLGMEAFLLEKSNIEKLFQSVLLILFDHINSSGDFSYENNLTPVLSRNDYCFKVPIAPIGFEISISAKSNRDSRIWSSFPFSGLPIRLFTGTKRIMPHLDASDADDVPLYTSESEHMQQSLYLTYSVQSAVFRKEIDPHCFENTPDECIGFCTICKGANYFRCIPFTYRAYANASYENLPYCNSSFTIGKRFSFEMFKTTCALECKNPCEYVMHHVHQTGQINGYSFRQFKLKIYPVSFNPYMQFTITKRQTREQFISAVAGIFNLYLGFSGITFVALLVQAVNLFKEWLKKKRSFNLTQDANAIELALCTAIRPIEVSTLLSEIKSLKVVFETRYLDQEAKCDARFKKIEDSLEEIKLSLKKL